MQYFSAVRQNLFLVFWCRLFYFSTLLLIIAYFYFEQFSNLEQSLFLTVVGSSLLLFVLQWFFQHQVAFIFQFYIPFLLDIFFIAAFVFITGGIESPFVFAFVLVIVVAGSQPSILYILITTLTACSAYVCAVYLYAWQWNSRLFVEDTLSMLLQTSALLLIGGMMASIAKRQLSLEEETHVVINKHRNLQALHSQLIASMQEGVLVLDANLRIQDSNQAAQKLLAYKKKQQHQPLPTFVKLPLGLQHFFQANTNACFQCEWLIDEKHCLLNVIRLSYEKESMWLLTMVDVSENFKLEQQMAHQDKLATLGRMASILAHEIRNPLQTISQAADIMQPAKSSQDQEMQQIMQEEIERLKRLINDILGYVQPFQPKPVRTDMGSLIESSLHKIDIKNKLGLRYKCKLKELLIDQDHARLVLDNLLHNAIRASAKENSIHIKCFHKKEKWFLKVYDQGSGIPEPIQARLFEPFISQSGIGLGLATVWQVCQANTWHVSFETSKEGTCFTIEGFLENENG
ncbi:MAG: ATP-binding protein [Mariprofundaceae bacterium]|nr:ATP-binding protein [Mariprofundaceae bacterium]